MTDPLEAHVYSCPLCGEPQAFSLSLLERLVYPEIEHRCPSCGGESPLPEWRTRIVRPFGVLRDVTGF